MFVECFFNQVFDNHSSKTNNENQRQRCVGLMFGVTAYTREKCGRKRSASKQKVIMLVFYVRQKPPGQEPIIFA